MKIKLLVSVAFLGILTVACFSSKLKVKEIIKDTSNITITQDSDRPNIIFFSVDDMNDFVNPLGYHQAITPNLDRLASMGVNFTNAHAPAAFCAPSRTAIWTGLQSTTTGCYNTEVYFYDYPKLVPMHESFKEAGYNTYGAGKLFHHRAGFVDLDGWDEFYYRNEEIRDVGFETGYYGDDQPKPTPYPYSPYNRREGVKITGGKFMEYGPIAKEDVPEMMGVKRTKWVCDLLKKKHNNPFFLALGLYTPHFPNYAPQKYFDMYDLDKLKVPEIFANDLDDIPEPMKKQMTHRSKIQKTLEELGGTKEALRGYLASVSYADGLLGEVLDGLDESAYKDNTIVVLWSDQGYHLGEKGNWGKHTLWSETSRVPFIIAGKNIPKNKQVKSTVGLIDIYPTLTELCGLPTQHKMDGVSLKPLLMEVESKKDDKNLFIPYHKIGGYSVINSNYRYIYYKEGGEEFYNINEDYNEYHNLINDEKNRVIINQMKKAVPKNFRKPATSKNAIEIKFHGDGKFHWVGKKPSTKPQLKL
jgi:arylsulfatase A-like enzyme